jgi:hypothetical protein
MDDCAIIPPLLVKDTPKPRRISTPATLAACPLFSDCYRIDA